MSLHKLDAGWMQFGNGNLWRCAGPKYLCEVNEAGNTPNYNSTHSVVAKIRRIKSFYAGKLEFGMLNEFGTASDLLAANAFAESYGTVPSSLSSAELRAVYNNAIGIDPGTKLDEMVRYVHDKEKYLERREPGYSNPLSTPHRVSLGAHHMLLSTARAVLGQTGTGDHKTADIIDLVCRFPSESVFAANCAIKYLNQSYSKHQNQPPLIGATYNAGSPRFTTANTWNLVQYGNHLDRWVAFYNTSRMN
jgi:hypothetical protein